MIKNKFLIYCFLCSFLLSCSISNPLKNNSKISSKDCPRSLILYESRSLELGNAKLELPTDYFLNCYLIEDKGIVEISIDYSLNVLLKEEEENEYLSNFIVFVTDESKQITIDEFKYLKELKIENNDRKFFVFKFNDKIQIDLNTYNSGVRLFFAIN